MDYRAELKVLVDAFCGHTGLSEARVANRAKCDGRFFARVGGGKSSCSVDTLQNVMLWFSSNWPADLEWPGDVCRPAPGVPDSVPFRNRRKPVQSQPSEAA